MIFVTDAAILYAYMLGAMPVWLDKLLPLTLLWMACASRAMYRQVLPIS